jgi:molybdenum cofactor guanylyltransferase
MYSAAILVGGRATRFGGRDKGALLVDGQTIRDRQIAALSTVADELLFVGGDEPDPPVSGRRHIRDTVPGCGPMGGVHAALSAAHGDAVAVVACDMPYLTGPLMAHLLALSHGADLVIPRTERGYHPLCAAYTRGCLASLAKRLAARDLKLSALLDDVRVRVVEAEEIELFGDPRRLLANVNTPADYTGLEALQVHKR